MRIFIAIDIEESIRKSLAVLQGEILEKAGIKKSDAKWVNPDIMHLTLKFLGEITDKQIVEVCDIVKDITARYKRFDMDIQKVGFFGGRSARVLWVGAGEDCDNLQQLQGDLEQALASAGWPPENRKFSGHLTLCRVRSNRAGIKLARITEEYQDYELGISSVDAVLVYQSELTPKGPVYTSLGRYELEYD